MTSVSRSQIQYTNLLIGRCQSEISQHVQDGRSGYKLGSTLPLAFSYYELRSVGCINNLETIYIKRSCVKSPTRAIGDINIVAFGHHLGICSLTLVSGSSYESIIQWPQQYWKVGLIFSGLLEDWIRDLSSDN